MNRSVRIVAAVLLGLSLWLPGLAGAQAKADVSRMLTQGFDLLEQGKVSEAKKVYEDILRQDPGHPLALNNLGAIMVKEGKYDQALGYFKQALGRAKGVKVLLNRVCDVEGVCAAYRLSEGQFGSDDLEAVVRTNMLMAEMARSSHPGRK